MGQAKRRGCREQRLAQRLGLVERSIDDVKRELQIPDEARFLGYAVNREDSDEFLVSVEVGIGVTKKVWSKRPQDAKALPEFAGAYAIARHCPGSVVVGIFDTATQVWVGAVSG